MGLRIPAQLFIFVWQVLLTTEPSPQPFRSIFLVQLSTAALGYELCGMLKGKREDMAAGQQQAPRLEVTDNTAAGSLTGSQYWL